MENKLSVNEGTVNAIQNNSKLFHVDSEAESELDFPEKQSEISDLVDFVGSNSDAVSLRDTKNSGHG